MAQRLLAEAAARPDLIAREPATVTRTQALQAFPSLALLSDPAVDIRQYLEDLVTMAVSSAQQAELVSLKAQEASRKARWTMSAVACFGALGVIVGVAGFAASRNSNLLLAEVRDQVSVLQDMERKTHEQLIDVASSVSDQRAAVDATAQASIPPPQMFSPPPPISAPAPAPWQPAMVHSTPWPDSRPQTPQTRTAAATHPNRTVVVPHFVTVVQRNLRAMFH
jgi:hypothetical protein